MISPNDIQIDRNKGDFHYETDYEFDAGVGLSEDVVRYISNIKRQGANQHPHTLFEIKIDTMTWGLQSVG